MGTDLANNPRNDRLCYGLPIAAILVVLLSCGGLNGFVNSPAVYILASAVVASSALYFGVGPAIAPVILTVAAINYFVGSGFPFHVTNVAQPVALLAFLLSSVLVMYVAEGRRRHNVKLQKEQAELEDRVKERTAELDAANHSLRQLSARLIEMQDDERRRIARELHDSVGQLLVGLSMNLSTVLAEIERLTKSASVLRDSEALVQEMSSDVRTISHLLHPPLLLDEAGLGSAIRWYIDGFAQRSKIKIDLDCPADFGRLPRDVETAIFRMVQECLTNVHRHSGSQSAKIRCRRSDSQVLIEVEDAGKGIPAEKFSAMAFTVTPGVGIRGMRERLRQLGGELRIKSDSNGTLVTARVPAQGTSPADDSSTIAGTSKAAA